VVVLGLARGGMPVAAEVARALAARLDVCVVRKLGVPGQEELAMGAIGSGEVQVLNRELLDRLELAQRDLEAVVRRERAELARREQAYRGGREPLDCSGAYVVVVDDGLATGSSMHAAVRAIRARRPARVIVAVPVGSPEACDSLRAVAEEVVCLHTPRRLGGVSAWYADFHPVGDEEVRAALAGGAQERR
jgi:predicted phosphoribosyltransferase